MVAESGHRISEELRELSGWEYDQVQGYSVGYLLRKLQVTSTREWSNGWLGYEVKFFWDEIDKDWVAQFKNTDIDDDKMFEGVPGLVRYNESADTPEDAAAKLSIELFKQGVLTRE